jgi:multicomponent Na+:H+ antiporter subunit E
MKRLFRPVLLAFLALLWVTLQGSFTLGEYIWGLLMGLVVLALFPAPVYPLSGPTFRGLGDFFGWLWATIRLIGYFLWELLKADIQVALLALRPRVQLRPGIIAMRLTAKSPGQIALLSALITLTPGTITIECSADRGWLYIHCIDATDEEGALAAPRRFEQMILEVLR